MATKAELLTEVGTEFPDNTTKLIKPINLRTMFTDFLNYVLTTVITSPVSGQLLSYDGTNWINSTPSGSVSIKRTVTSAEILSSYNAPITLVAAPGDGYAIQVTSAATRLNYNSIAYTLGMTSSLTFIVDTATLSQANNSNILASSSSTFSTSTLTSTTLNVVENKALKLFTTVQNPTTGNSTIDVYVSYKIITL